MAMNRVIFVLASLAYTLFLASCGPGGTNRLALDSLAKSLESSRILLPNGWTLSPAGTTIPLGDLPLNLVLSPSGKRMAITNNGQSKQSVALIDPATMTVLDERAIQKAWYGLVFSEDNQRLYASGGNDNQVVVYDVSHDKLTLIDSIALGKPWPTKISPTGISIHQGTLYVTTKEDSALYVINLADKKSRKIALGHEAYASALSPDSKTLYISLWGGSKVAVFDTSQDKVVFQIPVGSNPNELILSHDGKLLYVAHANDNGVSVIDTQSRKVLEVLNASLYPDSPAGSTPNALALSADEQRLYIANADNNCLAVFDVSAPGEARSIGFIPTDWYPTSVKVLNGKVFVTNGKGGKSRANPKGPNPNSNNNSDDEYIGGMFKGTLMMVSEPTLDELAVYAAAVYRNSPFTKEVLAMAEGEEGNPIPRKVGDRSPIKYVFYIIKENRTYDQVLGDVEKGNGDSTLCLFPRVVTPNQHALAEQFVLLDNFYVNSEVSADGHNWSTAAYANDYVEKTWPTSYGDRGGEYDYEGTREIAFPKDGFIWDYCKEAGITYRSYGEFVHDKGETDLESLKGHIDVSYPPYDLSIKDMTRFGHWVYDFDSLVAINAVPQLNTIHLPNNHTYGARVGTPTPRAMVAENDLALGMMIEHISQSPIWKECAIFVVEDDAQNGPDHVDAHRSIAFVAGPYVKRNSVVSRMYATTSVLRTIELILGLPPMSQHDAGATPMWECFTAVPDATPYKSLPARYNLWEMNTKENQLSRLSSSFNLEEVDAAPDLAFSEVIWKAIRGESSVMPAPVRSAFVVPVPEDDDDL
ncbi:MAG: bifunctional YncE family protein/alkaline phosphatase family protein [Cyclobacteriaceae bacterium]|nr:bifunctional YncE family protein/alkaline phosphatase family protein [Cyclobacteriaceae bacterium]